jgi:hypothetical protein
MAALALRLAEVALTALVVKALDEMWAAARSLTLSNG